MVKGIAILGSHPATVELAPFDDPEWRIYACSPHNVEQRELPRFDEWFEVHVPIQDATRSYRYLRYLESASLVWMRDRENMQLFPGAKPYPEKELKGEMVYGTSEQGQGIVKSYEPGKFSPFHFTSSIAYMLAKAIDDCEREGIKQIGLWGIMQASESEYAYQRPGLQYFFWEAMRRGIKVMAPDVSLLFHPNKDIW